MGTALGTRHSAPAPVRPRATGGRGLDDVPGELMAHHDLVAELLRSGVQVAAADPAVVDRDDDLVCCRARFRAVLYGLTLLGEDDGLHDDITPPGRASCSPAAR
jgi:hypothetical protein